MASVDDWQARALERHCTHCRRESEGKVYSGQDYLRALQGMRGDVAERLAHKVEPFFWSDADMIHVRLCDDCAARLRVGDAAASHATPVTSHD
ncbi:MAG TPA: hypothetical protein VE642_04895 [Pyrinomonadaceae bacterium]|jgi:hypothetical protein|nr:hypothetical protein [Pyrinomonadaceae bacterium]